MVIDDRIRKWKYPRADKSAPTGGQVILLISIIGPDGWLDERVKSHYFVVILLCKSWYRNLSTGIVAGGSQECLKER
jgi:hypothetical protein